MQTNILIIKFGSVLRTSKGTKGATNAPILAKVEADPTPPLRTIVGSISEVWTYTTPKAEVIPNLPVKNNTVSIHIIPKIN